MDKREAIEILISIKNECELHDQCKECVFYNKDTNPTVSNCFLDTGDSPWGWEIDENETT